MAEHGSSMVETRARLAYCEHKYMRVYVDIRNDTIRK